MEKALDNDYWYRQLVEAWQHLVVSECNAEQLAMLQKIGSDLYDWRINAPML